MYFCSHLQSRGPGSGARHTLNCASLIIRDILLFWLNKFKRGCLRFHSCQIHLNTLSSPLNKQRSLSGWQRPPPESSRCSNCWKKKRVKEKKKVFLKPSLTSLQCGAERAPTPAASFIYLFVHSVICTFSKDSASRSGTRKNACRAASVGPPLLFPTTSPPPPPRPITVPSFSWKCHSGASRTRRHPSPRGKCHGAALLCSDPLHLKAVLFKEGATRGRTESCREDIYIYIYITPISIIITYDLIFGIMVCRSKQCSFCAIHRGDFLKLA